MKLEMKLANEQQKKLKEMVRFKQYEEEKFLADQMQEKFQEDRRLDEAAKQRRQEEREQYKADIRAQKDQRQAMYRQEKEAQVRQRQEEQEDEDFKQRVIEAARLRLLKEHAQALGGFLPKGVLQKTEDLEMLAQFDTNGDGHLDANEVAAAKRAFMKFDANNDGELSTKEAQTALAAMRAQ